MGRIPVTNATAEYLPISPVRNGLLLLAETGATVAVAAAFAAREVALLLVCGTAAVSGRDSVAFRSIAAVLLLLLLFQGIC